jgi:quinolinate synthase
MTSVDTTIRRITNGEAPGDVCTTDLREAPWTFDVGIPAYGPGSSMFDAIPARSPLQGEIPLEYREASADELDRRILAAKQILGDRVLMLGHFYQRDEVVKYADYVGDSFQLAVKAKASPEAEAIVFCGVHFMAETADLLSTPDQAVILPNLAAGCSMADMADIDSVEAAWEQLAEVYGDLEAVDADGLVPVIPVTYMNSAADLKGFCGRHGGIVCTSSNASTVLEWAFARGRRVLFFPDQHLGRNTAKAMGV